ncbi:hypothetical protein LT493_35310 [Streptomyces tricolor]|nr:hypothetical protein [Streptomyces tricolor]
MEDADKGVEIAFQAVVTDSDIGDGTIGGFNGRAQGDIEKYEAHEAEDIAERVSAGGGESARLPRTTAAAARQLRRQGVQPDPAGRPRRPGHAAALQQPRQPRPLRRQAARQPVPGHPEGSRHHAGHGDEGPALGLLPGLPRGPAQGRHRAVQGRRAQLRPGREGPWLPEPRHADAARPRLRRTVPEGHRGRHPARRGVVHPRGGNPTESLWGLRDRFSGEDRGWFANDPLDGVLGIMSHDPEVSTEYLDPARNDNLRYLLHGRNWDTVVDHYATPPGGTTVGIPVLAEDGDVRRGFGAALEAATTGEAPGGYHAAGPHTEPQARILQHTINTLYTDKHAQELPKGLVTPMAHILTSYTPDTHETYAESSSKYDIDWDSEGSVWSDKDGAHLAVGHQRLAAVMRGVANDPEAFGHLYGAEQRYTHHVLETIPADAGDKTIRDRIVESSGPWAPTTASGRTSSTTSGSRRRNGPPTSTTGSARPSAPRCSSTRSRTSAPSETSPTRPSTCGRTSRTRSTRPRPTSPPPSRTPRPTTPVSTTSRSWCGPGRTAAATASTATGRSTTSTRARTTTNTAVTAR